MTVSMTYSQARAKLASLCDEVIDSREAVIIHRRGAEDVALLPAAELQSLQETAYLLRSPRNAERLLAALARARSGSVEPMCIPDLVKAVGLDPEG